MKGFNVYLNLSTTKYIAGKAMGRKLFTLMHDIVPEILPDKAGSSEPYKKFEYDKLDVILKNWPFFLYYNWERRRNFESHGSVDNGDYEELSDISIYIFVKHEEFINRLVLFFKEICREFEAVHGTLLRKYDIEVNNKELYEKHVMLFTDSINMLKGFPSLCWGTYLGEPYVELFGRERLLSAPCKVEEVGKGFYMQLTEDMSSPDRDYEGYSKIREETIKHLDSNAFRQEGVTPNIPDLGYFAEFASLNRFGGDRYKLRLLTKAILKEVEPGIYRRCTKEEEDTWFREHYPEDELEFRRKERDLQQIGPNLAEELAEEGTLIKIGDGLYKWGVYKEPDLEWGGSTIQEDSKKEVPNTIQKAQEKEKKKYFNLEEQIKLLMDNGVKFNEDKNTLEDMLELYGDEALSYEERKEGFTMLLYNIAQNEDADNIMLLDTECIYNTGDYKRILEELNRITNNILKIEDVEDYIDLDKKVAWVSYKYQGKTIKVDLKVEDDWVDGKVFEVFIDMLYDSEKDKAIFKLDTGDQILILGYISKESINKLSESGLAIQYIT